MKALRSLEMGYGLGPAIEAQQQHAEIFVRAHEVRVDAQGGLILSFRIPSWLGFFE